MRYTIMLLCCVLCSVSLGAQEGITNPLSTSETFRKTATTDTTRTILFPSPSLYSRSIPSFLFGVNWGTFGNRAINETMGQRFVDDHYVELPEKLAIYPDNTRLVVGLHGSVQQGGFSVALTSAFSSRADPELMLDTTTFWCDPRWSFAAIRSDDKSGATRGFRDRHASLVVRDSLVRCVPDSFATLPATILSGNTNARVMTAYGDPGDYLNGNELYVLLQVRRLGGRDTTISATDDTPVLRLKLDGYGLAVKKDGEANTEYDTLEPGHKANLEHPIHFRRTPKPTASETAFRMVPYKTSPAHTPPSPLWHYGHPTGLKRGYVWDDDTSAMRVVHDTMIESHGNVSSWSRYITITRGMLHASGNRVPLTGAYDMTTESDAIWPADAGGACAGPWVTYRGLVTFRTDRRIRIREPNDTIHKVTSNPAFTRNEYYFRGRPHPTAKDLRVTVEYLGHDTVEIDFVEFRTPHAHDVLTDEYRSEMMESIGHFEQQYLQGMTTAGRDTSDFKIMGFRLMEERGEPLWRLYRHMNQLLRGYAFGVMSTQPYDHFRHTLDVDAAPPLANGDRTWYWDYAPTGLANEQTAVPFIRNGQPYVKSDSRLETIFPPSTRKAIDLNDRAAFGLKYGVERTYDVRTLWPRPGYAGVTSDTQPWSKADYINSLSHYELSWGLTMDVVSPNKSYLKTFDEMRLLGNIGASGYPTQSDIVNYFLKEEGTTIFREYRHAAADSSWVQGWYDVPLQMRREANLYERLSRPHNRKRFYDGTPWIGHVWLYDNFAVRRPNLGDTSWLVHSRQADGGRRRLTAEEFRSDLILPLLLGARSVIVFYANGNEVRYNAVLAELNYERGFRNQRPWPIPTSGGCLSLLDTCRDYKLAPTAANTLELRRALRGDDDDHYFGSDRMTRLDTPLVVVPLTGPADTIVATAVVPHMTQTGPEHALRSHSLAADRWLLTQGVTDTETGVDILGMYSDNGVQSDSIDRSNEIYVAMRSPRREAVLFGGALQRKIPNPTSWTAGDTTWMDRLAQLRLVGWYGHGYTTQTSHDVDRYGSSSPLSGLIDLPGIRTRHPYRYFNTVRDFEPRDSAFFDVTVLRRVKPATSGPGLDTVALHNEFYLGVANRRTNPLVIDHADTTEYPYGRWRFVTPYDMTHDSVLLQTPYAQLGSREIDVPLRYAHPDGKPRLIRITEMPLNLLGSFDYDTVDAHGREIEHVVTIDTIVDSRSHLVVNLLPGEGKLFRCVVLPATDTVGAGYLAYSTQNKMVVWPVLNATGTAYTDSLRYHAVYHRRDTDPSRTGPWSVFYQRSRPYHRDSMPLVAGLDWEAAIRLSRVTMASTPSTDGFSRTRYYDVDSATYESHVDDSASANRDCSCGFPSLVIRETEPLHSKVFVVYSCEDEWARLEHKDLYFHIVENAFVDAAVLNPGLLDVNGKSLVIATKSRGHDGGGDTLKSLALHGTPVINAAANNHMYYAWSASNAGIGVGLKRGTDDWFPSPLFIDEIPKEWVFWFPNPMYFLEIAGDEPLYPSLNVYSNIAQGHTDATLVWQDGATNKHIRYTRLVPKITDNVLIGIDRMLPHFVDMSFDSTVPPKVPVHGPAKIAIVGGPSPAEEAELPVVVRSLQQDTMSMYIDDEYRDSTGVFSYNHETVAYGEWIPSTNMHRVRYNHFVDRQTPTKPELHYWWVGTTHGGSTLSLFHPVITNGLPRYDSLTWQGMVNDTLVTYNDSLHIFHGDLSDSALILNYSVMNKGSYVAHRGHKLNGDAVYWTGQAQFSALQTQQITLRRLPRVPAPPTTTYHYDFLRADGAWPHLSMRLREDWPHGIPSVRRILQYTATDAPSFIASAEQLYRETADNADVADIREALPATSRGIERNGERLTVRAALGDGRNIELFPVYDSLAEAQPPGFGGSQAMALLQASMTQPVATFVSQPFVVSSSVEMKILSTGLLRQGLDISIEEVDLNDEQSSRHHGANPRAVAMSAVGLAFAMADDEKPERVDKAWYVLTQGDGKLYRLRLTNEATNHDIYREDLDIAPDEEVFEKSHELSNLSIIDLRARSRSITLGTDSRPQVFPNPSTGSVTIAFALSGDQQEHVAAPGSVTPQLFLDVTDALGNVIITTPVARTDALELTGLSTGAYIARLRSNSAPTISTQTGTTFVVVR